VLGASAAGYVSALALAAKGRDVIILDVPGSATESPLADWMPADTFGLCRPLRAVRTAGTDGAFRAVCFYSSDLGRQAAYRQRSIAGYVLRSTALLKALDRAAGAAGVSRLRPRQAVEVHLEEHAVALSAGTRTVRAALLLIARDRPAEVVARLQLPVRAVPTAALTVFGLDAPIGRGKCRGALGGALHVVALSEGERFGMFFTAGPMLHVRIVARAYTASGEHAGPAPPVQPDELAELIGRLQKADMLPPRLELNKAAAALWRPPGGVALELETHLAKRTLLVGTAGGFASALAGQTLDPSIRSALVAADVAERALRSDRPQEVLAEYKTQWRDLLADRIRPTGASLQMLMPMVLANKAMAQRFARALLYGENL